MRRLHLDNGDKAGLYVTAIFHLAVMIVLLLVRIGVTVQKEHSFVVDFTQLDEKERQEREMRMQEVVTRQLEAMIEEGGSVPLRNVRVNAGALRDDRGTDAEELYRDAERLARELHDGQVRPEEEDAVAQSEAPERKRAETLRRYSGPSVLSWSLDGRKASRLPIPAYRCYGAGQVTVIIAVNNQGDVVSARIQEDISTYDKCLRDFALRAARLSRFSTSESAPARQMGTIVYSFIAQ